MSDLKTEAQALYPEIMQTFAHLHANPEVSWKEVKTTEFLVKKLHSLGLKTITFSDCTGVVGIWENLSSGSTDGKSLTVALRADIDALWQAVDGKWRANHSCGHDAHMTVVLSAVQLLKISGFIPDGTIKVIFQPAEEMGAGALKMVEKGVADDVDYLYGVHLRPIQELPDGKASPAIYNGATLLVRGEIHGTTAHGARPHLGVNAIEVASALLRAIQDIHINPMIPSTVKMTSLHAGDEGSSNIIPDYAKFTLDVRTQSNAVLDELYEKIQTVACHTAAMFGARITLWPEGRTAAAEVAEEAKVFMKQAIEDVLGAENTAPDVITPGGEDFHFYTLERPRIKATMLGLGCGLKPGLHHPHMTFNREALISGARIMARAVVHTFEKGGAK
ncbi:amidohydrolase [Aneurinibacillus thermoaerophilus]|uniref:Amidohydrolase n=1 Tax=Aneurinibacillus thermoaerophilus TaxID=143495 RepID=A0A1G8CT64_ANETH|nr:amidohydrolase [Aneurinibacillus thermoaerophilus]